MMHSCFVEKSSYKYTPAKPSSQYHFVCRKLKLKKKLQISHKTGKYVCVVPASFDKLPILCPSND
jgi:hypothetical protein